METIGTLKANSKLHLTLQFLKRDHLYSFFHIFLLLFICKYWICLSPYSIFNFEAMPSNADNCIFKQTFTSSDLGHAFNYQYSYLLFLMNTSDDIAINPLLSCSTLIRSPQIELVCFDTLKHLINLNIMWVIHHHMYCYLTLG